MQYIDSQEEQPSLELHGDGYDNSCNKYERMVEDTSQDLDEDIEQEHDEEEVQEFD